MIVYDKNDYARFTEQHTSDATMVLFLYFKYEILKVYLIYRVTKISVEA